MKRPQKLAVMLVPTPPYEICGLGCRFGNYSGRQNELQNGGQEPRSSLFGEPSMAAFNASKRLFFCLRIVDR